MSSQQFNDKNTVLGNPSVDEQPTHHLHGGEEPMQPVADYSVEALEGRPKPKTTISDMYGSAYNVHSDEQLVEPEVSQERHASQAGSNAFNSERPLDVHPTQQGKLASCLLPHTESDPSCLGDVAVGGQSDLPLGKASALDKVVGKTEKVRAFVSDACRRLDG